MGKDFSQIESSKIWANQKSNELLTNAWMSTKNATTQEERVGSYVKKVLDNVEGLATKFDKTGACAPKNAMCRMFKSLSNDIERFLNNPCSKEVLKHS